MAKKNREQRRHEKFGGGRTDEAGVWPTSRPNPVFDELAESGEAATSAPEEDEPAKAAPAPKKKPAAKTSSKGTGTAGSTSKGPSPKR